MFTIITIFERLEGLGSGAPAAKIYLGQNQLGVPESKKWWPHAVNCLKKLVLKKEHICELPKNRGKEVHQWRGTPLLD